MPRGTYFSLLRQRKVGKRKATLVSASGFAGYWPKAMGCAKATSCQASPHLTADNRVGCAQNSFGLKDKSIGLAQTLIAKTPTRLFLARLDTRGFKPQNNHHGTASSRFEYNYSGEGITGASAINKAAIKIPMPPSHCNAESFSPKISAASKTLMTGSKVDSVEASLADR